MKKLNRWIAALLCLAMVLVLAACDQTPASNGENTAPEITGVQDSSVEAGSEFDALAGVTATDAEDGDLTGKITITSMPSLDFKNGKATPESAGSYELTYSVTDAAGETAEAYATLTVTRQTGDTVMKLDFTPTGFFAPPEGDVREIEPGTTDFTVKDGETVVLGTEPTTAKKGDRVRFRVKFRDVPEEKIGESVMVGFYLDPSDPIAETEGPAYQDVNTWIYLAHIVLDGYETVLEYPLAYSGEYRFSMYNRYADCDIGVESFSAEVIPAE